MNHRSPAANPRRGILVVVLAGLSVLAFVVLFALDRAPRTGPRIAPGQLGDGSWVLTSSGILEERLAEFSGSRLRLRVATRPLRGEPLKFPTSEVSRFLGARTRDQVSLKPGARLSFDLDWNHQANGSGLTAGLALSPVAITEGNPYALPQSAWVEFIGVPPGKKARRVIGVRENDIHRHLDSEGWPDANREGRAIAVQRIEVRVEAEGRFRVFENGEEAYVSPPGTLKFDTAYVYLQVSSRANYPPREVFFDNIVFTPGS